VAFGITWYFGKDWFLRKMNHEFKGVKWEDCPERGFPGTFGK
jgi:hypothetical protein